VFKRTITYKDLDGNDITDDFYFNLSKAEIAEWKLSFGEQEDLASYIKDIIKNKNTSVIIKLFKDLLGRSVGRRSEDGKRFIKNDDIRDAFMQSDAYSVFFMELVTNANAGVEFIRGVLPSDLANDVDKHIPNITALTYESKPEPKTAELPPDKSNLNDLSKEELLKLLEEKNEK
jgi:hypothetical protein